MIPSLERLPKVQLHHLAEPPSWLRHFPFIITAPFKIFHQVLTILVVLIVDIEEAPEFLLVQVSEVMMSQHGLLLPCALRNVSPTHMRLISPTPCCHVDELAKGRGASDARCAARIGGQWTWRIAIT